MPNFTILNVKDDLTGIVGSTTLDKVTNLNPLMQRAARNLLSRIDPTDTKRVTQITNALHDDVYDYSAPSDLKGNKVIDIRPQINRATSDSMSQRFSKSFDLLKRLNTFQVKDDGMVKTLRIAADLASSITLHDCDSLTANGTWAATVSATNLTADTLDFVSGSASLNFDMSGSTTSGYLENSTMSAVDLSDEEDIGTIFLRFYVPDTSIMTSVALRWGSSSSAYWSRTATTPWNRTTWQTGWNIVAFNWNGATKTGSPDSAAIDYLRVTLTLSSATADTDFRLDKIACSAGEIWEIEYYSKFLFQSSAETWKETTNNNTDYVNLDTDALNIFEFECALAIAQQLQGKDSTFGVQYFKDELYGDGRLKTGLYMKYEQDHPSEAIRPKEKYYDVSLYG